MLILLSFKTTFKEVYGEGHEPQEYTGHEYTERINASSYNNIYVHDCVFRDISSSNNGGALCCNGNVHKLHIEQSSFISCSTSDRGGGIYFDSTTSGQCVLSRICAFDCSATDYGQFAFIFTNNNISYLNNVNKTSIMHILKKSTKFFANIITNV